MRLSEFQKLMCQLIELGYGDEIEWQEGLKPCDNSLDFRDETIWVILNSGMKEQIARMISDRIKKAINEGRDISTAFNHKGKVAAIKLVIDKCGELFMGYCRSENKIQFLQTIPYIGKITCWHLAKNLGEDCVKPDRHLVRISEMYDTTPQILCEELSRESGFKKATVDIILWRSANLKLI